MIATGWPSLASACSSARSISSRPCPLISSARQPNASARRIRGGVPAEHRLAALTEAVDVDDRDQVVQRLVACVVKRLPDRPIRHLAVPTQHPDPVGELLHGAWRTEQRRRHTGAPGPANPLRRRSTGSRGSGGPRAGFRASESSAAPPSEIASAALYREYSSSDAWPLEKIRWSIEGQFPPIEVITQVLREQDRHHQETV